MSFCLGEITSGKVQAGKAYCVIGQPIAHSLSPLLHNTALKELGLDGCYQAVEVAKEELAGFFAVMRSKPIAGCNITLPHKVDAMAYVDEVTPRARLVGAINTVYWKDGRLVGENTDVTGFAAPLRGRMFSHALVLGAGGVSRAAIAALKELKVPSISLSNRTGEKAVRMAQEFGIAQVPWEERGAVDCDLVINATSLGMKGKNEAASPVDEAFFSRRRGLAYDIIYTPEKTVFLQQAERHGWRIQSGLAMFVEQGRAAFKLWTGVDMPSDPAYACITSALEG